jgi:hypothetical protein
MSDRARFLVDQCMFWLQRARQGCLSACRPGYWEARWRESAEQPIAKLPANPTEAPSNQGMPGEVRVQRPVRLGADATERKVMDYETRCRRLADQVVAGRAVPWDRGVDALRGAANEIARLRGLLVERPTLNAGTVEPCETRTREVYPSDLGHLPGGPAH